jgi:hypothetical protein
MPKTYLRYVQDKAVGVIATPLGNVVVDATGTYACTPALEDVGVWMMKTGRQVRARCMQCLPRCCGWRQLGSGRSIGSSCVRTPAPPPPLLVMSRHPLPPPSPFPPTISDPCVAHRGGFW